MRPDGRARWNLNTTSSRSIDYSGPNIAELTKGILRSVLGYALNLNACEIIIITIYTCVFTFYFLYVS
jgi:hypothetical protein